MIAPLIETRKSARPASLWLTRPVNSSRPAMIVLNPAKIDDRPSQYSEIRTSSRIGRDVVGRPVTSSVPRLDDELPHREGRRRPSGHVVRAAARWGRVVCHRSGLRPGLVIVSWRRAHDGSVTAGVTPPVPLSYPAVDALP